MNIREFMNVSFGDEWIEVEELKQYWHEAAHAVVARLYDFPVDWVSTDTGFFDSHSDEYPHLRGSQAACMTRSAHLINPILNKRSALNKRDKEILVGYARHVLAGPFFEQYVSPQFFEPGPSINDFSQVHFFLKKAGLDKAGVLKLKRIALRDLKSLASEHFYSIAMVAFALYPSRTIYSDELDEILAQATASRLDSKLAA